MNTIQSNQRHNITLNGAPSSRWTLRDKAAQRPLAPLSLGVISAMETVMETEHKNVRLDFSTLVPLFFVVGFGAGVLFIPFSVVEFFDQGLLLGIVAVVLTPLVNGLAAVAFLFCGFPVYALIARKRAGYTVRLVKISASHNGQCSKSA